MRYSPPSCISWSASEKPGTTPPTAIGVCSFSSNTLPSRKVPLYLTSAVSVAVGDGPSASLDHLILQSRFSFYHSALSGIASKKHLIVAVFANHSGGSEPRKRSSNSQNQTQADPQFGQRTFLNGPDRNGGYGHIWLPILTGYSDWLFAVYREKQWA